MKKVIITVDTSWCGMKQEYASIVPDDYNTNTSVQEFARSLAYDNFEAYDCIQYIVEHMFEWDDDLYEETGDGYTNEQYNEASSCESDYYEWSIDEIDEEDEDELEDWKTYPFETYASK